MFSNLNILILINVCSLLGVKGRSTSTSKESLVLLVSFDGFRWDYLKRGITPTFNKIGAEGGRTDRTVNAFVTKTFPNHYTLVNGLYEESHGIIGNKMYDPTLDETFDLGNLDPKWWSQNNQVEPIWITNQRQGGSSGVIDYPGMDVPFKGMLPNYEYSNYDQSIPFNERSELAVALLSNGSANFVALYYHEPDHTGHLSGPDSDEMDETLKSCDKMLGYLQERLMSANLWDRVNLIVTSDHGMAAVSSERTIYADQYLNEKYPYFTTENNPLLGIWPNDSSHTDILFESMKKAPHVSVFKKEDIPAAYHYRNNIRTPPIVVSADLGWMVMGQKIGNGTHLKGDHGYNNSIKEMNPMFMVHGPGIKSGSVCEPFNSVDVYPLMCHLLGIKERPNNGTLKIVGVLLRGSSSPPTAPEDDNGRPTKRHHSRYFTLGIAFATLIGLLAVVLVAGMCLQQRKYRQTERDYHSLGKLMEWEDEEVFEDRDMMLPNTNI